ncbi:Peptide chain release factor 2 [Candidatus Izimaplasma bacterium HR1]|jgi:peptide chain release factor 2|uniref:peptide chain release factor 2 n=1 Tax=Candidatus Izimoplasma sp. HR1 TaxID=1541959 RepID=UPI0004F71EBF|nr:Peptide chain release factor 2 [Candidatus Izimaplasma bacterium HR1]
MQLSEIKQKFHISSQYHQEIMSMIDYDTLKRETNALDQETYDQDFWNDSQKANKVIKELKSLKNKIEKIDNFVSLFEELEILFDFIKSGEDMADDFASTFSTYESTFHSLSVELLLTDSNDKLNAILEIHPGAGGTESQDWADMLYRMYKRHSEINHYELELLDYLAGDEAGIKSVTFSMKGPNAFGYLKAEHGVHRLVRISPFDSSGRRHTSFASVTVIPEIDDSIDVELNEKELKIDTYRSSGAGGQSVNTTDSAVRVTHLPTNTVVTVQNERSQIKNRETALKILKGKLYMIELEKKTAEISSYRAKDQNSFGSQIRSYVMHPYSMVKDHRTSFESGNVTKVLDGDLDGFINTYLKQVAKGEL